MSLRSDVTPIGAATTGSLLWRAGGRLHVTIIVKATYQLQNGGVMTVQAPDALCGRNTYLGDQPTGSLLQPTDLVPYLAKVDVLLTGHAVAPPGGAASRAVRLMIHGRLDKSLHVFGDRIMAAEGPTAPKPFTTMPLVYERAAFDQQGGHNPVGLCGVLAEPLPNIVDPADPSRPAGFGPLSPDWRCRQRQLVTPEVREQLHGEVMEIPDGFDWSFFQSAPVDQQISYLNGDEWLLLDGLDPEHERLQSRLPGAMAGAWVWPRGGDPRAGYPVELRADLLHIKSAERRCSLCWRGSFPIQSEQELASIHIAAGVQYPTQPIDWPAACAAIQERAAPAAEAASLLLDASGTIAVAAGGASAEPDSAPATNTAAGLQARIAELEEMGVPRQIAEQIARQEAADPEGDSPDATRAVDANAPQQPVTPFDGASGPAPPRLPASLPLDADVAAGGTMMVAPATSTEAATPFEQQAAPEAPPPPPPAAPPCEPRATPAAPPPPPPAATPPATPPAAPDALELTEDLLARFGDADPGQTAALAAGVATEAAPFALAPAGAVLRPAAVPGAPWSPEPSPVVIAPAEDPRAGTFAFDESVAAAVAQARRSGEPPAVAPRAGAAPQAPTPAAPPPEWPIRVDPLAPAPKPFVPPLASGHAVAAPAQICPPEPDPASKESPQTTGQHNAPQAPAMVGPLATPEMLPKDQGPEPPQPPEPGSEPTAEKPHPEPTLPVDVYPLERCAAITAALDCRPENREQILEEHRLKADVWSGLEKHWEDAVDRETSRGKTKLMDSYDHAYVSQIEAERGPIEVPEYARISVAIEHDSAGEVLEELKIPRQALMRIKRVWLGKMMQNPALHRRVREVVDKER